MRPTVNNIVSTFLWLTFGNTLAASMIWGINTIFLLDAGLSNFEAFAANAFFTIGMVLFEVPTGVIADTWGRRASYLLGTLTLILSTFLYFVLWQVHAEFWLWAVASLLLGLGFTFFSGAVEAWLVDALDYAGYEGKLEAVLGKGQMIGGIAMLVGTISGGLIAQFSSVGVPYLVRSAILLLLALGAWKVMRDYGFTPEKGVSTLKTMRSIVNNSVTFGFKVPAVRFLMLSSIFTASVGFYAFYALQPHLLVLYGDTSAYWVAGLAAALIAASQIAGGLLAGKVASIFTQRTTTLIGANIISCLALLAIGFSGNFWITLCLVAVWGIIFSLSMPVRQSYLNSMIPSRQRATVLSFDSLVGNVGGVAVQPALGRVADVYSYGTSFVTGSIIQLVAVPLIAASAARRDTPTHRK